MLTRTLGYFELAGMCAVTLRNGVWPIRWSIWGHIVTAGFDHIALKQTISDQCHQMGYIRALLF